MSNVDLTFGGRTFTVACAPGEENRIAALGRMIDGKLAAMGDISSQSENRMLLFAALFLADELDEMQRNRPSPDASSTPDYADQLEAMANRLENLASRLET